ncbi:hypothetical protein DSM104299_05084 [Baekduia alba]|uniref:NmrA family NAD(P)-binding protein n=1 Tax=Baekduia alba TaxID=2997333 RepID=UPI0023409BAE|nr:NmrA family NAD(P)-binding protein [Baekduia alba]WCB96327.1 hypothetical protein DSM104299_05084 [Baekduia alba]
MSGEQTVLVVGATGRIAGLVVPELARRGARVRALARDDAQAAAARRRGVDEIALGDLRDPASLRAAVRGADGVFHIGPAFVPDEAQLGLHLVEAAVAAGVRRFAFSGVLHPTNGLANHASKQPVEQALYASGMDFAVLQPATVLQNIAGAWPAVVEHGSFGEPFSARSRVARVDYRDVAEVAAIALTEDRLAYGTYELAADGMPDRHALAAAMSDVVGHAVVAVEPSFEAWRRTVPLPYTEEQWALLAAVYADYHDHGSAGNGVVLRAILGREPRTPGEYLRELHREAPRR